MESYFSEMLDAVFQSQMVAAHSGTISTLIAGFSTLGLLWSGGHQVLAGTLTIGRLMAMHALLGMVLGPIERLANANQAVQDAIIAAGRLGEVLELEPEIQRQRPNAIDRPLDGAIEFRDVTFRYGSREPIFKNVSLHIEAGECVGLIGKSGSGKTTLVNLIARFLEPVSGQVLIDGIDVRDYTYECLRRQVVYVPQDIVLLTGSIADNIRFASPTASAAEVQAAARAAGLDHEAIVGERGLALSGGERQRVAIARAILLNPVVLVLDEPTAHLDTQSEAAVQELIDKRRGRFTTIVISHRPLHVDRVVSVKSVQSVAYAS
jgi:ABC-type bacteriocin/lantibiotic exporter with double-glycine peptidase domain